MLIWWKGRGFVVPALGMGTAFAVSAIPGDGIAQRVGGALLCAAAGGMLWGLVRRINGAEVFARRAGIDVDEARAIGGFQTTYTFLFIPIEWWSVFFWLFAIVPSAKFLLGQTMGTSRNLLPDTGTIMTDKANWTPEQIRLFDAWEAVAVAWEQQQILRGRVERIVSGVRTASEVDGTEEIESYRGLSVDLSPSLGARVLAFLPESLIDRGGLPDGEGAVLEPFVGQELEVEVIKFNRRKGDIIISRRTILERENDARKAKTIAKLSPGDRLAGIVQSVHPYGAFVDVGGLAGLLHITDIHPPRQLKIGDEVALVVLAFDSSQERLTLAELRTSER